MELIITRRKQVRNIQEDVNFYVESNQDPDFAEDEGIYDELSLEEAEAYGFANEDDEGSEQSAHEGNCRSLLRALRNF